MAVVFFSSELEPFTGESSTCIEARDYRELINMLLARYPRLENSQLLDMAVAIDGEIIVDPLLERLTAQTEVHFMHFVAGG